MTEHDLQAGRLANELKIELVRFRRKEYFADALKQIPGLVPSGDSASVDPGRIRRHLMARSWLLSERMSPDLHQATKDCAIRFGIREPIEICQASGAEDAAMHLSRSPVLMEIKGKLLSLLDTGALKAVIGHEMGITMAHGSDGPDAALSNVLGALIHGEAASDEILGLALRY